MFITNKHLDKNVVFLKNSDWSGRFSRLDSLTGWILLVLAKYRPICLELNHFSVNIRAQALFRPTIKADSLGPLNRELPGRLTFGCCIAVGTLILLLSFKTDRPYRK
jgi:hypothetical protein